jgi:hypothetical protein
LTGVKVSAAVTAKEGLVVGMRSMPGNPATRLIVSNTRKLPPEFKKLLNRRQMVGASLHP